MENLNLNELPAEGVAAVDDAIREYMNKHGAEISAILQEQSLLLGSLAYKFGKAKTNEERLDVLTIFHQHIIALEEELKQFIDLMLPPMLERTLRQ